MNIFSAGEAPIDGVHASDIVQGVRKYGPKNAEYIKNKNELNKHLCNLLNAGDVLITLGAGDVWQLGRDFLNTRPSGKTN